MVEQELARREMQLRLAREEAVDNRGDVLLNPRLCQRPAIDDHKSQLRSGGIGRTHDLLHEAKLHARESEC